LEDVVFEDFRKNYVQTMGDAHEANTQAAADRKGLVHADTMLDGGGNWLECELILVALDQADWPN
jgi:hypothetical protein